MSKLYPPVIEGTLPAFYSEGEGMVKITIPFSMNRAVSQAQVSGFELKIKSLQSGTVLYTIDTFKMFNYSLEQGNCYVTFYLDDKINKLKIGQFYKLQLAYITVDLQKKEELNFKYQKGEITLEQYENILSEYGEVGYFTGMSIAKYTTKPTVEIKGLDKKFINPYTHSFTGLYKQTNGDITEKVHTYRFDVFDSDGAIVWSSGDCLHNINSDTNLDFSEDRYQLNNDVEYEKMYYVQYSITTSNGLSLSTVKYKMVQREYIDPELYRTISLRKNFDEGYIDILLDGEKNENGVYPFITGSFILVRAEESTSYTEWQELKRFKFNYEAPASGYFLYRDYLLEQGKNYKYAIYQYNDNNLYSKKIYSEIIQADYEDAFLLDPEKQLKLKYNLKMSKFANTHLEQKTDTIGGQFPFIFRNGNTNYHEFNIQGLISYFMDEAHSFVDEKDLIIDVKTIDYTTNNVAQERIFKMNVLEWLNDGKPKLFRSPTEGNFIIRLIKISLKPEQKLGRLLHNFSGTAYEIAEYNYTNLCKYGFINTGDIERQLLQFETIDLKDYILGNPINQKTHIQTVNFTNVTPGTKILITFNNGDQEEIVIGVTGNYNLDSPFGIESMVINPEYKQVIIPNEIEYRSYLYYLKKDDGTFRLLPYAISPVTGEPNPVFDVNKIYYKIINTQNKGYVTYSYFTPQENSYATIKNVNIDNITMQQFIGTHDILKEINFIKDNNKYIKDVKKEVIKYYHLIARPRPIEYIEKINDGILYYKANVMPIDATHPFTLFCSLADNNRFVDLHNTSVKDNDVFDCDDPEKGFFLNNFNYYSPEIIINGQTIVITHETEIDLSQFDDIVSLYSRNGVVVDLIYQTRTIDYKLESTSKALQPIKNQYLLAKNTYEQNIHENEETVNTNKNDYLAAYKNYIIKLTEALEKGDLL